MPEAAAEAELTAAATLFFVSVGLLLPPEEPEERPPLPKLPLRLRWPGLLAWKTGWGLWTRAGSCWEDDEEGCFCFCEVWMLGGVDCFFLLVGVGGDVFVFAFSIWRLF